VPFVQKIPKWLALSLPKCGVYLKKSEPILLTGSAGGISPLEFTPHNSKGICAGPAPALPAGGSPKSGSGKDDFKFFFGGKFFYSSSK
jgi:hypothetical protein